MLSKIIESGESARAMTLKRAFSRMFSANVSTGKGHEHQEGILPDVPSQMLTSGEAETAGRVVSAVKSL